MAARTEKIRQDIPDMISTTEQQGQRAWGKYAGAGQLGKEKRNKTAGENNPDNSSARTGKRGQDGQNMTARRELGQDN